MMPSTTATVAVTLDDLDALNREIAALVGSGLPLDAGLQQIAADFRGSVGGIAQRLARSVSSGKSLVEALEAEGDAIPPVYHAVVAAGLKTGRLPAALEAYAEAAAHVAALRRIAGQTAIYPLLVMALAVAMLMCVAQVVIPAFDWLGQSHRYWIAPFRLSSSGAWMVAAGVPAALVLLAAWWWRAGAAPSRLAARRWKAWIPGAARAGLLSAQANFAELLALLVGCRTPLGEALPLAARASGSLPLERAALSLAGSLERGATLRASAEGLRELPPLVRTALLANPSEDRLRAALLRAAAVYRQRASAWIVDVAVLLPIAATAIVGFGVVAVYGLLVLQPYFTTLRELADWQWQ
jgi:general secretion pathway protein F